MDKSNAYYPLIFRVVAIMASSMLLYHSWQVKSWVIGLLATIILLKLIYDLLNTYNKIHRKINYFFDSIENEDYTLNFNTNSKPNEVGKLNGNLNRLKEIIRGTQIKIRHQETYYQELLNKAEVGVVVVNALGHVVFSNPKAQHLLATNPLNHIRQLEKVSPQLSMVFGNKEKIDKRIISIANEREIKDLSLKKSNLQLNDEMHQLFIIQDIQSELDQKETDSWMKLIKVLTHEIMNTMTPVISISDSLLTIYESKDQAIKLGDLNQNAIENTEKGLKVIKNQSDDLMKFVNSYRSVLSVPKPDKSIIGIHLFFEKIEVLTQQMIGHDDVDFKIFSTEEHMEIFADEQLITLVMINLVKNALNAMQNRENSRLTIEAGITASGNKSISVRDNGIGIPKNELSEIFIPFYTTKENGSGIGLSLSKQIMQLHGGQLKVHSQPDVETVFMLVFQ